MTDFQHSSTAHISINDRGFMLGDGVFDTALVINGTIIHYEAHVNRLIRHAAHIGIDASFEAVTQVMRDVLSCITTHTHDAHHVLRTTITRGQTSRGLWPSGHIKPTIVATLEPFDRALMGANVRLTVSSILRNETSPTSQLKTLNYLDAILASREAIARGFDDALLLNTQHRIACSTVANIFVVKGDQIYTPPLSEGAVDGVMREVLLKASNTHFNITQQKLTMNDMMSADGVFLTNSLRIMRQVTQIDQFAFNCNNDLKMLLIEILGFEHNCFSKNLF